MERQRKISNGRHAEAEIIATLEVDTSFASRRVTRVLEQRESVRGAREDRGVLSTAEQTQSLNVACEMRGNRRQVILNRSLQDAASRPLNGYEFVEKSVRPSMAKTLESLN